MSRTLEGRRVSPESAGRRESPKQPSPSLLNIAIRVVQAGPFLILVVFWIVMSLASPYFLGPQNIGNLLLAASIPMMLALGQLFVVLTGEIDLSSGANYVLCAVVGAIFAHNVSSSPAMTIIVMLLVGGLVGALNGYLAVYAKIASSFVVTLGTLSVVTGAIYVISNGLTVTGMPQVIQELGGGYLGPIPISAVVVLVIAAIAAVAARRLRWGRWVYAVGSSPEAATRVGMPVRGVVMSVFVLSGLSAGVAGVFEAGLTNAGAPTVSFTSLIDAITAVVIGGAALTGGRGTVIGTLIGGILLQTIHNGLNLLSVNTNWEPIVLGGVLLLAVALEKGRERLETNLRLTAARQGGDL